jgi:predicted glutamine amidotransferase
MCRLFLHISNRPIRPSLLSKYISRFLEQSSQKQKNTPGLDHPRDNPPHRTGYGFAYIDNNDIQRGVYDWKIYKTKDSPDVDSYRDTIVRSISHQQPKILLGHLRKIDNNRTVNYSPKSFKNAHPFIFEEHAFIHNGIIIDFHLSTIHKKIVDRIRKNLKSEIQGQTDSEHIFFLFLTFLEEEKERLQHAFTKTPYEQAFKKMIDWFINNEIQALLNIIYVNSRDMIYLFSRYSTMSDEEPTALYMDTENMIISSEPIIKRNEYHLINTNTYYVGQIE